MNKSRIHIVHAFVLLLCWPPTSEASIWKAPSIGGLTVRAKRKVSASSSLSNYFSLSQCRSDACRGALIDDPIIGVRGLALRSRPEQAHYGKTTSLLRPKSRSDNIDTSMAVQVSATAALTAMSARPRPLVFWENMVCGAISRSIAQTIMHPANTMKTILQSSRGPDQPKLMTMIKPQYFRRLTMGAGANFLLSVPHGAVNFAVLEFVRSRMTKVIPDGVAERLGPGLDFLSSSVSTICCSVVSTPQMMITDNIMAGNYPNLPSAIKGLYKTRGIQSFYAGWFPGLAGKIPSYALTWTLFQRMKKAHRLTFQRDPKDIENSIMGCIASATTVCIMIPIDTIKTRLVTQAAMSSSSGVPYKGVIDCAIRVYREEGIKTFYRGLAPRLVSVVPMIGIQFGVYEFMKKVMLERSAVAYQSQMEMKARRAKKQKTLQEQSRDQTIMEFVEATMEVAADNSQPFPAPQFHKYGKK